MSDADRRSKEARMLARLRHPAIVALYDARLDSTPPYLVLEYTEGESLAGVRAQWKTKQGKEQMAATQEVILKYQDELKKVMANDK